MEDGGCIIPLIFQEFLAVGKIRIRLAIADMPF
jgi:hypothetical protein